jgi:hypothetical protein
MPALASWKVLVRFWSLRVRLRLLFTLAKTANNPKRHHHRDDEGHDHAARLVLAAPNPRHLAHSQHPFTSL